MKTFKPLLLLLIAACCSFIWNNANAACNGTTANWTYTISHDTVSFHGTDTSTTAHHYWLYGDGTGNTSNVLDPTHVYAGAGTYTVCMYAYVPGVSCTDSVCQTVTIASTACGQAYFLDTVSGTTVNAGSHSSALGAHPFYAWYLDGQLVQQMSSNPLYSYTNLSAGSHSLCLYLYNGNTFCDSFCRTVTITSSTGCGTLTADWTFTLLGGDSVLFEARDTNSTAHHNFTFGDNTYGANTTHITHVYSAPGTYHVCFYAYFPNTNCVDSLCADITIPASTGCGQAYFLDSVAGSNVYVTSHSSGVSNTAMYAWYVDGHVSMQANPNTGYVYQNLSAGTHSICLYLYNTTTFCDSFCRTVTIASTTNCGTLTASWNYTVLGHDSVLFEALDTISTAHHIFNFGDGTYSTAGTRVVHVYSAAGTYHVCFYAYLPGTSCTDSLCQNVTIPASNNCGTLTANWNYTILGHDSVLFEAQDTISTAHHIFNFGDGTYSTSGTTHLVHVYSTSGTYHVCFYAYLPNTTCTDSFCQNITIPASTGCGQAYFYDSISGSSIIATSYSSGVGSTTNYAWYLDGHQVQAPNPNTRYTYSNVSAGTHSICLYLYNGSSFCDSFCRTVIISSNPCNNLSARWTQSYLSNNNVQFFAADTTTGVSHYWHFGDGTVGTGVNPIHAYTAAGLYHVCQYVYVAGASCVDSFCYNIQANASSGCQANYSYTLMNIQYGVQFSNLSTSADSITSYYWTFGDGTTSTDANPHHVYTRGGGFWTCLTIATAGGCTSTRCDSVHVTNTNICTGVTAGFTYSQVGSDSIKFTPSTTNTTLHHQWNFGDGSTSTSYSVLHVYAHAGTYTVCDIVTQTSTNCTDTVCQTIIVTANVSCGTASFVDTVGTSNIVAHSTSTGVDTSTNYYWFISSSNGTHIQTQYGHNPDFVSGTLTSGTYHLCLYLIGPHTTLCDSMCETFTIASGNPCAGLDASYTVTYSGSGGIHFVGVSNSNVTTSYWTFGDGTSSTLNDPTHYYTSGGVYTVCHIVSIPGTTCADTSCTQVQGSGNGSTCHANFSDSTVSGSSTVYFTSLSTSSDSIISYSWSFGDGSTGSGHDPHHTYTSTLNAYQVCLTITTVGGCTSTLCDSVHIGRSNNGNCHASFTYAFDSCNVIRFTNTSTGGYTGLTWYFGNGVTDSTANPVHTFAAGTYTVYLIVYNSSTGCQNATYQTITVQPCSTTVLDTVCGVVFNDANGNGVQDQGEHGIGGAEIHIGSYTIHADSTGHYIATVPAGTYYIYYCAPVGYTFTIPVTSVSSSSNGGNLCGVYQSITIGSGTNCGFNFGIQYNSATICGLVFFDANNNGNFDANTESGIANVEVHLTDTAGTVYTVYTDQYGHYCAVVPAGHYTITILSPAGVTVTPGTITIGAAAGNSYSNNNFAEYTAPGVCNLSIQITPNTTITPGYPAWYEIQVCNVGSNTTSGTVNLFYDPSLTYNYSSPAASSQNSSTYTATWALNNLLPGSCQNFWVSLTADSFITPGQFIFTLANVTTNNCNDADLTDNVDTLHQNATASWDPNNKFVTPAGVGPDGRIQGTEELIYTINFQNDGNATAVNVVIHDTISNNLDLETIRMAGASHPNTMSLSGREVIWKFNAIMLPDSATDEQASHGFVRFAIKPVQSLPQGTQITNTATIFFDYNEGMTTNSTLNTIDYKLSVEDIIAKATITLQPNPFSQYTTIKIEGGEAPFEMHVYDMVGKMVKREVADNNVFTIQRSTMAAGMYMYEVLEKGKVIGKGKMIAQ